MTEELPLEDFDAYWASVYGDEHSPFPWQRELLRLVCSEGWPSALDVPTGAGKTAAIDVAVFHLAREARREERPAPVRIVFVVDRRLVVDEAFERARRIARALAQPESDVMRRIAAALSGLAESPERPLVCARLRGGAPKEPDWTRSPAQPTILVSTVDQVGSRYLFRGYGVRDTMRPVHAGLLGMDALVLLDEAHLSQPFLETLEATRRFQEGERWSDDAAPAPFHVVTLSATQTRPAPPLVTDEDRRDRRLGPRLTKHKPVDLVLVKDRGPEGGALEREIVRRALAAGGSAHVVGIVVNRVRRARTVFELLRRRVSPDGGEAKADVALLIGRSRPLDREQVLEPLLPRMAANRRDGGKPLFVVATQCIEAGVDLDFDALVTEIAPLDALRQRFGRLNRMGRDIEPLGAIVAEAAQVAARGGDDPLYGAAPRRTWRLLESKAAVEGKGKSARRWIDFGIDESRAWLPSMPELEDYVARRGHAPVVLAPFVDKWARTSPAPADDPEVALFLHGPDAGPADVNLIWRADVSWERGHKCPRAKVLEAVSTCPPSSLEALAVPLWEARRWLAGEATGDVADVEGAQPGNEKSRGAFAFAFRWRGPDDDGSDFVSPREIRPGDTLVVPSRWGGCDPWGWKPEATVPVTDLGEEANRRHRGRDILRLSRLLFAAEKAGAEEEQGDAEHLAKRWQEHLESLRDTAGEAELLERIRSYPGLPPRWADWMDRDAGARVVRSEDGRPLALERRAKSESEVYGPAVTEDDESSAARRPVPLADHSEGVQSVAEQLAAAIGLPPPVAEDVVLAAFLHDSGKAHPSFQQWLYGGDEVAAIAGQPLAKSGRRLGRSARARANLPPDARHELASVLLALAHPKLEAAHDRDLVLWLVGTHHGWGRPFFPPVQWPEVGSAFDADLGDGSVRSATCPPLGELLDWWMGIHERVARRYGPWGLARLEAIVRLADHRRSEMEEREEE